MGVTTQELFKMMEAGELVASEFLPKFTVELRKAAREGGALEAGLKTSRVEMQKMSATFKLNVLEGFDAGMEEGLANFYASINTFLKDTKPFFQAFGKILGTVVSVFGDLLLAVSAVLRPIGYFLGKLTDGMGNGVDGVNTLVAAFKNLYFWILAPFALLEKLNQKLEETGGAMSMKPTADQEGTWYSQAYDIIGEFLNRATHGIPQMMGMYTPEDMRAMQRNNSRGVTNNIQITSHDAEETARKLQPYIQGQINESWDFNLTTSMAPGD